MVRPTSKSSRERRDSGTGTPARSSSRGAIPTGGASPGSRSPGEDDGPSPRGREGWRPRSVESSRPGDEDPGSGPGHDSEVVELLLVLVVVIEVVEVVV